jgi:hypothetical protein
MTIKRHVKIRAEVNAYDPRYQEYIRKRTARMEIELREEEALAMELIA